MQIETYPYDTAEFLEDDSAVSMYLQVNLKDNEMPYLARSLATAARARGGLAVLSAETGIPIETLQRATNEDAPVDSDTITKVMEAYRRRAAREPATDTLTHAH